MKQVILLLITFILALHSRAQNVGIGTTTPASSAALEIRSTTKGVLFPSLTTAQRDAIVNPANGLHIFNTDQLCLNYYDSANKVWNCYCDDCKLVVINITANACKVDFYETYAKTKPSGKYIINIAAGVTLSGCNPGDEALSFANMPGIADIIINNYGTIAGAGGAGGDGRIESGCTSSFAIATPGQPGGNAIRTKPGIKITLNNSGLVSGGGGGGGGGSGSTYSGTPNYGGGGGGGAGMTGGTAGLAGGAYYVSGTSSICSPHRDGISGTAGTATTGGSGGAGKGTGTAGGNGGNRAQEGTAGSAAGGIAGKAIAGGSGNVLNNIAGGQSFGVVD